MPAQFSAFAGGGLRFTSRKPKAESIYETLREGWGSLFSDDPDAVVNIETFAQAKTLALAAETLERAGNEANPLYCTELLPKLEIDWRTNPPPTASINECRGLLASAMAIKGGDGLEALRAGLRGILGDGFLAVAPQPIPSPWGSGGIWPAPNDLALIDGNPGNFCPAGNRYKVVKLITGGVFPGKWSVAYQYICGDTAPIAEGERVTINPLAIGRTETVLVTRAPKGNYPTDLGIFEATFLRTHENNDVCTTAARPYWVSYRRFLHIVVTPGVLESPELCRRCHEFLGKATNLSTQWALVVPSGDDLSGPFTVGSSVIGHCPVGTIAYTAPAPVQPPAPLPPAEGELVSLYGASPYGFGGA